MNDTRTEKEKTVVLRSDFGVANGRYSFCWRGLV